MDGLSAVGAVASIAGIVDIAARSIFKLYQIKQQMDESELVIMSWIGELTATKTALEQIRSFVDETMQHEERYFQLYIDLDIILKTCHLLMTFIDGKITSISSVTKTSIDFTSRIRVALADDNTESYLTKLHRQLDALGIIINTFKCRTLEEQVQILHAKESRELIDQVKDDSTSLFVLFDDTSFVTRRSMTTTATSKLSLRFPFDGELLGSKAYHRAFQSLMSRRKGPKQEKLPSDSAVRPDTLERSKSQESSTSIKSSQSRKIRLSRVSSPENPVHLTHVGHDLAEGLFTTYKTDTLNSADSIRHKGLPEEWREKLAEKGITYDNRGSGPTPQALIDVVNFYAEKLDTPSSTSQKVPFGHDDHFERPRAPPSIPTDTESSSSKDASVFDGPTRLSDVKEEGFEDLRPAPLKINRIDPLKINHSRPVDSQAHDSLAELE